MQKVPTPTKVIHITIVELMGLWLPKKTKKRVRTHHQARRRVMWEHTTGKANSGDEHRVMDLVMSSFTDSEDCFQNRSWL